MLDIRLIRQNPDMVRQNLERRNDPEIVNMLDELLARDAKWRRAQDDLNRLRAERNTVSRGIAEAKKSGGEPGDLIARAGEIPAEIKALESRVGMLREEIDRLLLRIPNLLDASVPVGADEGDSVEVRRWGQPREFDFQVRSHGELAETLKLADFDRARKVAGAGFNYLLGDLALLDMALMRYAVDFMIDRGYIPVEPPLMMRRRPYEGVTDLGDFEEVMYKVEGEDLYLIATSEHPMAAMYMDEIIDEDELPIKLVGISPCFRREIGGHGVDTKGLFRMHQFNKVEQFVFCRPEDSWKFHEELLANTEGMYQGLGIPYRVVNVCTGDIGNLAAKKYDLEAWFPRQSGYGEVASCSNCTDYQARRLNIRCGKHGSPDKRIPHTLNNTAIATSRTMVAILENYQNADGTVTVPEVLRPYMGGIEVLGGR